MIVPAHQSAKGYVVRPPSLRENPSRGSRGSHGDHSALFGSKRARQTGAADRSPFLNAPTSTLAYWAACVDQQIATFSGDCHRTLLRLMAARRELRAELELHEGLLLTLATPACGVAPAGVEVKGKISRDPRLNALFSGRTTS